MTKIILLICLSICLVACSAQPLQLQLIDDIPAHIEALIASHNTVQLITSNADGTYIAIHTQAPLEASFDVLNGTLQIHLYEAGKAAEQKVLYMYALTRGDATYEAIEVYINNKLVPFNSVTTF